MGGHDVTLVADQDQHHGSGRDFGCYHNGDLTEPPVALPVYFFVLWKIFSYDVFKLFNLNTHSRPFILNSHWS
jgi:hypothetical protein